MPEDSDLDAMASKIAGVETTFALLTPDQRVQVMQLALLADIAVDTRSISNDMTDIGHWFEKSRLFDGLPEWTR